MNRRAGIAWLSAALHLVAAMAMLLILRKGLAPFPAADRLTYIGEHRAAWVAGWLTWSAAAISLIVLIAVLSRRFQSATATAVAIAGLGFDLSCEYLYMFRLPDTAPEAFAMLDRRLEILIGAVANGLYTVALVLLLIAGWRQMPRRSIPILLAVIFFGVALAVASVAHSALLETAMSGALFPLFIVWLVMIARWLQRDA